MKFYTTGGSMFFCCSYTIWDSCSNITRMSIYTSNFMCGREKNCSVCKPNGNIVSFIGQKATFVLTLHFFFFLLFQWPRQEFLSATSGALFLNRHSCFHAGPLSHCVLTHYQNVNYWGRILPTLTVPRAISRFIRKEWELCSWAHCHFFYFSHPSLFLFFPSFFSAAMQLLGDRSSMSKQVFSL